ncbi:hypothetical protein GGP86_000098 [Salinibacter ruber]|uniref:hypothetical protein n=1 Tax=Salinibacter ruber TaxID=146919 RepID=UPI0021691644|nr:hypothetical protein [Salinibacter ruber]MCS3860350.1 hypothetical protein [Salinibacter ruber]
MSLNDKYIKLINSLINRTEEGDVEWRDTSTSKQFAVYLDSGNITVDYYPESRSRQSERPEGYSITIFNDEGNKVDEIKAARPENNEDYDILKELYSTAKRSYLKVDETIDGMISEISEEDRVGGEPPSEPDESFDPDDPLPF